MAIATTKEAAAIEAERDERWLFVDGVSAFGGHEVMLLRWLEELTTQPLALHVVARQGSPLQREAARYATVLTLPVEQAGRLQRIANVVRDAWHFARALFTVKPTTCVVVEGCLLAQPLFAFVARLFSVRLLIYVPLVQTSTSMGFGSGKLRDAFVRHVYGKLPHAWITITDEQASDFRRWAHLRQPILMLPNTVARAIETDATAVPTAPRAHERLRIVVLGRLEAHQKGLDTLLDHLSAHPSLAARFELTFVGEGPFEPTLRARLAADSRLASWTSVRPWSPTIEVLRAHDVLLMTSRYEGVPLVMLEAMALNVPVVGPNLDGLRAFLAADCLFQPGDLTAAFDILERLRDVGLRTATAARNRAAFQVSASNAAFAIAVKSLTANIQALGSRRLHPRSA